MVDTWMTVPVAYVTLTHLIHLVSIYVILIRLIPETLDPSPFADICVAKDAERSSLKDACWLDL